MEGELGQRSTGAGLAAAHHAGEGALELLRGQRAIPVDVHGTKLVADRFRKLRNGCEKQESLRRSREVLEPGLVGLSRNVVLRYPRQLPGFFACSRDRLQLGAAHGSALLMPSLLRLWDLVNVC